MKYGRGKSDSAVVAEKLVNKVGRPAAEPVEQRAGAKGNADQQTTCRAQNRESVSRALGRIRQAARQRKEERFTSLFHHISIDLLQLAFFELKRSATPGVDGLTWQAYEADLDCRIEDLHARVLREHTGHCHHSDGIYRSQMVGSARSLSLRLRTRSSNAPWQHC